MTVEITPDNQYQWTYPDYQRVIISLVGDLKELREFSETLNLNKSIPLIDDVLERVEKKSFTVAIVGEFKRGKSTFINALLGKEILPSDILPTTATLNRVIYGVTPLVKVLFKDGREEEVGIDKLKDYVTKLTAESEETAANVKEAVVYYPVHYCQNNVEIIDTPGLNDEANMDEVTLSVLPEVDAAIMVVMALAPFSEYERRFLEEKLLTNDLGRIIFVVTGIDRCNNQSDVDRVVKSVQERLQKMVIDRAKEDYGENSPEYEVYQKKIGTPKVFGLSAYQALEAKKNANVELLAQSRFSEFETSLERFLTEERGATFLQVPVNRVIASANEILNSINLRENALSMKQEEFRAKYEESVTDIKELREKNAEEMKQIDGAAAEVKNRVKPLVWELENELLRAAEEAIDSTEIKPAELQNKRAVSEKLGRILSEAIQRAARIQSEKIQTEIEVGLVKEVSRLETFAKDVTEVLQRIEMQFSSIEASTGTETTDTGETIAAVLAVCTGMGGIWSGYKEAGIKGAAIGAAGSVGIGAAAFAITLLIGLPFATIVGTAGAVISVFTGAKLVKAVLGKEQVTNFKANYKVAALQEIEKRLSENNIERKVDQQVYETFDALKQKIHQEVESLLDNTQNTLADISAKREREEVMSEHEHEELQQIRVQTERILGSAQGLSRQLIQQVNLAEKLAE